MKDWGGGEGFVGANDGMEVSQGEKGVEGLERERERGGSVGEGKGRSEIKETLLKGSRGATG